MPRAATITELEQHIESLQPSDQLQLLEKMVHHLKRTLLGEKSAPAQKHVTNDYASVRGALKQYANPSFRKLESSAYAQAMQEKHAIR